jgi:hypothetical protein
VVLAKELKRRELEQQGEQLSGLQIREGGDAEKDVTENTQDYNAKGITLKPRYPRYVLRGGAPRQHRAKPSTSDMPMAVAGPATMSPRVLVPLHQHEQHAGQSVGAPNVNSLPPDNSILRIVAAVQQLKTEFNGAVSEEE